MYRWVRFSCVVWSLFCCAVLVPSWNRASAQDIEVIYSEDFESTPAFQLPPGWTEENWTDPLEGSFVAGETTNLADSAELMGWTVLTEEHLRQLGGNRVNVPSVFSGNSVYAESDQRSGLQFQYLYTPVYDLRDYQDKTIVIAFDSNYMQNQDNINFAEYTLQGNLEDNEAKTWYPIFYWVDAPEIPAAKEAAAADPTYNAVDYLLDTNFVNDDNINSYAGMIRADRSLIDIDRHVEGLINDNEVTSKRRVFYALPLAAGQQYVQICFAQCGGASWFWGIDNFVLGTMASQPPDAPVLEPLADVPAGESVSLVASAFSDPDAGDTHKASTWQIAIDETFDTIVFESADDTVNLTSITVPPDALVPGNVHYARVKYSDQNDVYGAFSDPVLFFFGERELPPGALFFEDFNGRTDEGLAASGWVVQDTPEAVEDTTFWTMSQNTTRTPGPPGPDGQPTTGQFLISDSDRGNKSNPTCGGGSHDVITPPFDASDANQVFLHFKTSAVLNNNGKAVFDIDVSVGGGDFVNVFRRVAPSRFECEPFPEVGPDGNMGAAYGPVTVDLTQVAAGKSDVRIRFRHFEPNWDWWIAIDDVLVDQNPPPRGEAVLLAKEGFDNGIPGTWKVGGTDNVWAAGDEADPLGKDIVWNAGGDGTHLDGRGINRLAGQPYAMFQPGQDPATSTLDTPALDCSEMAEVFLHVDSEYLPESSFGPNEIQVSVDGGNTFSTIFAYGLGLLDNGEDAFFNHYDFPVPQAAGKPEVAFRFLAGGTDTDAFWVIDNVEVTGTPKPPLPPGVFFVENFDDQDDESLVSAGWTISDTPQATEVGTTWTSEVHRDDTNPPGPDGLPTTGNYIISDSDAGSGENPPGSGASHDIVTPSFSTAGSSDVWLHFNASVILNNNGEAIFDVDVSTDGGATFVNQYRCIAPSRSVDPRPQPGLSETQQTGGLYGPVHIRLPAAIDQPDVRIRFRHFEPNDDWWVAIDDIVVDEFPPPRGEHTILSEGFENGIPSTWTVSSNTSEGWRTTPLDTRNVDSILSGNGPSDLGGRTLNNLAGQGYVIHQMC